MVEHNRLIPSLGKVMKLNIRKISYTMVEHNRLRPSLGKVTKKEDIIHNGYIQDGGRRRRLKRRMKKEEIERNKLLHTS